MLIRADVGLLDLRLRRRLLLGYAAGMAGYALVIVGLYPQFKNSTGLDQLTKNGSTLAALFGAVGSLTTPAGWLGANIYNNFLPLIVLFATIGYGASCVAGQDEDGTLCLETILPVSRTSILLQKAAALTVQATVVTLATTLCVVIGRAFELAVPVKGLVGISVGVAFLGIDFGLCALAIGCRTGSRGAALGATSAIAAGSYLISSVAPVVGWVRPARYASLFYWSVGNGQLTTGLNAGSVCVLVGVALALLIGSVVFFQQLDLR